MLARIGSHHINVAQISDINLCEIEVEINDPAGENAGGITHTGFSTTEKFYGEIWMAGLPEPILLDKEMANQAHEVIKDIEKYKDTLKRLIAQNEQAVAQVRAREQELNAIITQVQFERNKELITKGRA